MAEYIERRKVSNACYEVFEDVARRHQNLTAEEVRKTLLRFERAINSVPAADVAPVVHGEWVVDDYDSGDPGYYAAFIEVHCSKCGYELGAESGQYGWAYGDPFPLSCCPNCGAKMDGERKGDDGNEA